MSAWMCTKTHIGVLAEYYARSSEESPALFEELYLETFELLNQANCESLAARYGDPIEENRHEVAPGFFAMGRNRYRGNPVAIIKAAHCFEYQACEYEGWARSEACKRVQAIIKAATFEIPGYGDAPWGIDDPTHTVETQNHVERLI